MMLSKGYEKMSANGDVDNPETSFIPANASWTVRATQILALVAYVLFADESLNDIFIAFETFPNSLGNVSFCHVLSCLLRGLQGFMAAVAVLFLVMTSSDVIEIVLSFTAVNFISALDNSAFELAKSGRYGTELKKQANLIVGEPLPDCMNHSNEDKLRRYRFALFLVSVILFIPLFIIIASQEKHNVWTTGTLRVQFQDKTNLQSYNGCYNVAAKNENKDRRSVFNSLEDATHNATFAYCKTERRWYLFEGTETDPCEAREDELAHSSKTDSFDISTSFGDSWYSYSSTPLSLYFTDLGDKQENCSLLSNGNCDEDLNEYKFQYDGGDCCAATCIHPNCGSDDITDGFGAANVSGDGFPNCIDPKMVPITLKLDNIYNYMTGIESSEPKKPRLTLHCDGKDVLSAIVGTSAANQTQTVKVKDGAECTLTVGNRTRKDEPIFYVDYSVFDGDEKMTTNILEGSSFEQESTGFQKIPSCFSEKLKNHVNIKSMYNGIDPSNKAIDWLMKDAQRSSKCEDPFFIERYALFVLLRDDDKPNNKRKSKRQCSWSRVTCKGESIIELDLYQTELSGTIATEIGLLTNLKSLDVGKHCK